MTDLVLRFVVSLLPVVLFLVTLVYLDSYKLVHVRTLVMAMLVGSGVALVCLTLNNAVINDLGVPRRLSSRYVAPVLEETLKAAYVAWLIRRQRVGFLVDAAIVGFATGTGFALIENTYYLKALETGGLMVWIVRGLGTAVMHGGMTAIFAIVAKQLFDRHGGRGVWWLPGLAVAVALHSLFNHFILPPLVSTVVLHVTLPTAILFVFWRSERATKRWLGMQMDVDAELLDIINEGRISESRIGRYVEAMKHQFTPEVLIDILCYLRLHVELAISAKGLLMMREAGFKPALPEGTQEKFRELKHLEKTIGPTGRLAIAPFLHSSSRDLWQIYMLDQ
ncbi:MAG: PrsW family intramembrane metalloprotease [Candidatus Latescibacteria bacterium]|nr:PrsW family intramembrane metalloprotease [Candidatus Latescibacterota bacterium]